MNMDTNLRLVTKAGLQATPKRQRMKNPKVIDVIELSDDSDAEIDAPQGHHQPSKSPSKSGFRGLTVALDPEVSPSPTPCKSATARTRTQKHLKPAANVDVGFIDISSDEEERAAPITSPITRCRFNIQSNVDDGDGIPIVSAINWGGWSGLQASQAAQDLDIEMSAYNTGSAQGSGEAKGKGKEGANDDKGANPTRAASPPDILMHSTQPVASGSNFIHQDTVSGELQLSNGPRSDERAGLKPAVNYEDTNREVPSDAYRQLSVHYLRLAFPFLPKNIIAAALYQHDDLYAPTYLHLHAAEQRYTAEPSPEERPYPCNATKYSPAASRRSLAQVWDEAFGNEWAWVEEKTGRGVSVDEYACMRERHGAHGMGATGSGTAVQTQRRFRKRASEDDLPESVPDSDKRKGKQRAVDAHADVQSMQVDADIASVHDDSDEEGHDGDIECGCCFGEYTFDKMVQCPDGHLFCSRCISQYAATQLGAHNPSLVCMDSSDCKIAFPESELRRVLTPKLMELYSRLVSQRVVAAAGLDGLEECPFCDWKCIMEVSVETDTLFRCGNEEGGCGVVSCRKCKNKDHLPKTCQEMERDHVLDGQHAIEEAMTRALMRNCPNPRCNKAFIKEAGCNKMTCPFCGTYSCYVCRKIVTGYGHFGHGGCRLHENVETRHANEVRAAAKKAAAELKRLNPELDHAAIKVDLPQSPTKRAAQRFQEEQRRLQQQQLLLQRRQEQFRDLFRRQETLRQEDLRRQREDAETQPGEDVIREELTQQQNIAVQARGAALGAQVANRGHQHGDAVRGLASTSHQFGPHARAYAHAFNMLHGENSVLGSDAQ